MCVTFLLATFRDTEFGIILYTAVLLKQAVVGTIEEGDIGLGYN